MKLLIILILILLVACTNDITACKTDSDCRVTNYGKDCCTLCDGEAVNMEEYTARQTFVNTECTPVDFAKCAECPSIRMRNSRCVDNHCQ